MKKKKQDSLGCVMVGKARNLELQILIIGMKYARAS